MLAFALFLFLSQANVAEAHPSLVNCSTDEDTILKAGANVMGMIVTPCSGTDCLVIKYKAVGDNGTIYINASYAPTSRAGQYLAVRVAGQVGSLRSMDNTTATKCPLQLYQKDVDVGDPPNTTAFAWVADKNTNPTFTFVWSPGGGFGGGFVYSQVYSCSHEPLSGVVCK